jgi:hypothetical protein
VYNITKAHPSGTDITGTCNIPRKEPVMEYKSIPGPVFSRTALSPPVINSSLALQFGLRVPCVASPGQFSGLQEGVNVKLRMVVDRGTKKMTCHAKVDWIKEDSPGTTFVGFGSLSLSDEEFAVLLRDFAKEPGSRLEIGERVRDKAPEVEPLLISDTAREIMRLKAVNFPVSVIEEIDAHRGSTTFSEFVVHAVRQSLKSSKTG